MVKQTQADFNTEDNSNSSRPQSRGMDTQDTVILTGASQDVSSAINRILEDVADSSEEEEEEEAVANEEPENKELKEVGREGDSVQGTAAPDLRSDPESDDEKAKEEGEGVKVSKKRKRRLISDSEGSEDEEKDAMNESEEDNDDADLGVIKKIDYDSDENPVVAKPVKNRMLTKGGKLRKDFVEGEAELSGSEEVKTFTLLCFIQFPYLASKYVVQILGELFKECFVQGSDDEDERGLDRFEEMEGDLDDIDEDKERDKVIMIFVICEM